MAARAAVQKILEDDLLEGGVLHALGFEEVYASNSIDTPPEKLFVVVRWEEKAKAFGRVGSQMLSLWFHTKDRDYGDLDKAQERAKDLLEAAIHVAGADGWVLTQADWRGDSTDLIDDGFGTLTRNSGFNVVSRYDPSQQQ